MTSTITSATVGAASTSTPTSAAAPTLASPSAAYTLTLRVELAFDPGTLGRLTTAIGTTGANLGRIDAHHRNGPAVTRTIDVLCRDEAHGTEVVEAVRAVRGVTLLDVADKTFALHEGGKIRVTPSFALETRDDLSIAYTPGVARVSAAIATDPERVWDYAIKRNAVAVLTDDSSASACSTSRSTACSPSSRRATC
ncbi:ACT domain-containing protein [Miniimonas sp. S16]|uniref:ACT domain-containing protein n=1 Tax=Miniimonas sp. S16 TaxID=2171623 RepID=UPI000D525DD1|nr:ACT domain-containing protein [Miniimonas sp. S16]